LAGDPDLEKYIIDKKLIHFFLDKKTNQPRRAGQETANAIFSRKITQNTKTGI